jgi:hypothetical protein
VLSDVPLEARLPTVDRGGDVVADNAAQNEALGLRPGLPAERTTSRLISQVSKGWSHCATTTTGVFLDLANHLRPVQRQSFGRVEAKHSDGASLS